MGHFGTDPTGFAGELYRYSHIERIINITLDFQGCDQQGINGKCAIDIPGYPHYRLPAWTPGESCIWLWNAFSNPPCGTNGVSVLDKYYAHMDELYMYQMAMSMPVN